MLEAHSAADKLAQTLGKPRWLESVDVEMRDSLQTIVVYASKVPRPWPKILSAAAWEGYPLAVQWAKEPKP